MARHSFTCAAEGSTSDRPQRPTLRVWLLGAAFLGVVIGAPLYFSDTREFVTLAVRWSPWWMAFAILVQAAAYVVHGEIWRGGAAAATRAPMLSIGPDTHLEAVVASFMISSLVRTLRVVPGGLGTFEATSVVMLTS